MGKGRTLFGGGCIGGLENPTKGGTGRLEGAPVGTGKLEGPPGGIAKLGGPTGGLGKLEGPPFGKGSGDTGTGIFG